MPITIAPPAPANFVGPGAYLTWTSNFIGPIQSGSYFHVLVSNDSEGAQWNHQYRINTLINSGVYTLEQPDAQGTENLDRSWQVANGQQAYITVELRSPTNQVLDSGQKQATWSDTAGLSVLVNPTTQVQGGFTETDRQTLQTTAQDTADITTYVQRVVQTVTGAILSTPIGGLLAHPDIHLLDFYAQPFTLSGRGVLTGHPQVKFTAYYGIQYQVTEHPVQWGVRDGVILEWQDRVVQFAAMYRTRSNPQLYPLEIQEFHADTRMWLWGEYAPEQIWYDVTPLCELTCVWLAAA